MHALGSESLFVENAFFVKVKHGCAGNEAKKYWVCCVADASPLLKHLGLKCNAQTEARQHIYHVLRVLIGCHWIRNTNRVKSAHAQYSRVQQ